jgi:hypothetical protein
MQVTLSPFPALHRPLCHSDIAGPTGLSDKGALPFDGRLKNAAWTVDPVRLNEN